MEVVDLAARSARVVVPDFQLSLAIGKEGQNARLAARLTGWRIDIRSDEAPDRPPLTDRRTGAGSALRARTVARLAAVAPPIDARTCAADPVRTCVGCRQRAAKRELLRVTAGSDADGHPAVVPDPDGHAPGRGAHLHPTTACYDLAVRREAFAPGPAGPATGLVHRAGGGLRRLARRSTQHR